MPLAVVLILLVVGSLVFHFLSPWTFTPLASNWGQIDFTIDITFVVTGLVFVAVNIFMAWCVIRYRSRAGNKAHYEPENQKLEWILTVVTTVGVAAMLAPGLWVWAKFVDVPDNAVEVEAVGQQWHWSYRLPGEDGEFGNVDTRLVSDANPFGLDPDDPLGRDDILIYDPELHLLVDQPVKVNLRSKDVLHNFTVAQFRVKMDLVPGMETYMWLTPTETGRYELLCEELCGVGHFAMRGAVIVDEPDDYENWVAEFPTFGDTLALAAGNPDVGRAQYGVCAACHGQQGEGLQALNGPKLTGQSEWYLKDEIHAFKAGLRGSHEGDTYGRQMVPMAMTLANDAAINNVVAYIQSLPDTPAPQTVTGNPEAGAKKYVVCVYCHGSDGQGVSAMKAPRLAGMSDWYLARQLANFRDGVRGTHPQDYYGKQMGFMSQVLQSEQSINDIVAYINTL